MRKFWRPETGIFLVLWLLLLAGGRSRFLRDPGTFWHTVVGEQMLREHRLIYQDEFSFTFAGHPWSPHQWLGECVMAALYSLDGLDTLLLATVTVLAALYTWLAARLIRAGLHWTLASVVVALALAASSSHFHIRPHIGTIVGMAVTVAFLTDFDSGRIGVGRLFLLVPVYLLWTNIHGGMLGGLATMVIAIAGWAVARLLRLPSPLTGYRTLLPLGLLVALCALTALVNPYGTRMPQIWMGIMDSSVLPQIIREHAPLDLTKPDGLAVLAFAGVYGFVLVGVLPACPRVSWLLPLVWLYLGCTRVRHAPLFAVTATVAIADMMPHTRWARALARSGSDLFQFPVAARPRRWDIRPALLPICVVTVAFVLQQAGVAAPVIGHGWARLDPAYWPVEAVAHLQPESGGRPVFNEYLFGGFLIRYAPGCRVFVDDRCELYGDRWLSEYVRAEESDTASYVRDCERRYAPFDRALTRTGSRFDRYFASAPDWKAVARGEGGTLYERPPTAGLTASSSVPAR